MLLFNEFRIPKTRHLFDGEADLLQQYRMERCMAYYTNENVYKRYYTNIFMLV